jgi:hypothetical protein
MKRLLAVLFLSTISVSAFASYTCSIEQFGDRFLGKGESKTAAQIDSRIRCTEKNNTIFCSLSKSKCKQSKKKKRSYCEIEAFGKLHYSFSRTKNDALEEAVESCLESNSSMFCRENSAKCYSL